MIHKDWYLTIADKAGDAWSTKAAFDNRTQEFGLDSSFTVMPYTMDDPLKNCETIGPQEPKGPNKPPGTPGLPGQPSPSPPASGSPGSKNA